MCRRWRMLPEITAVLAKTLQHRLGIKSPHGQHLEQRRCTVTLTEDESITLWIGGFRRINLQHMKIECSQNINARQTRAEMRRASAMGGLDNPRPQHPCDAIELFQVALHTYDLRFVNIVEILMTQ